MSAGGTTTTVARTYYGKCAMHHIANICPCSFKTICTTSMGFEIAEWTPYYASCEAYYTRGVMVFRDRRGAREGGARIDVVFVKAHSGLFCSRYPSRGRRQRAPLAFLWENSTKGYS